MPEENTVDYASLCEELSSSVGDEKLYKWVLGETKTGTHCSDCEARAGKVKTIAEWKAMGKPKCKCKCKLVLA